MIITIIIILLVMILWLKIRINKLENNLLDINLKLDKIAKQVGVPKLNIDDNELYEIVKNGKRFEAANKLVDNMGFTVKEAHKYIDKLIR